MTELLLEQAAAPPTFGHFLLGVKEACMGSHESDAWLRSLGSTKAAMNTTDGTLGGYLIPPTYSPAIYNVAAPISIVRPRATIVPFGARSITLPYLDQMVTPAGGSSGLIGNMTLNWGALAETAEPTFRAVELVARKLSGYWISSVELDEDTSPTMDVIGPQLMGRAVSWYEDSAFIGGSGAGQPLGVINAPATIGVTRNSATDFKLIDVYAMLAKAHPNSINAGTLVWVVHPTVIPKLIASNGLQPGDRLTLGGYPIKVSEQCSVLGTAGDVLLCDFAHYLIGERGTTSVAISPHPRFTTAQDIVRLTHRIDGQPWLSGPMTLKDGSTTVSPFIRLV